MDTDLQQAVELLALEMQLSGNEAEELLGLLEQTESEPNRSVLFPENCDSVVPLKFDGNVRKAWLVVKRAYVCNFAFIVIQTKSGRRAIAEVYKLSGVV